MGKLKTKFKGDVVKALDPDPGEESGLPKPRERVVSGVFQLYAAAQQYVELYQKSIPGAKARVVEK